MQEFLQDVLTDILSQQKSISYNLNIGVSEFNEELCKIDPAKLYNVANRGIREISRSVNF